MARAAVIALIVFCLLALGAYFVLAPGPAKPPAHEPWLRTLDRAAVTALRVTLPDQVTFRFERIPGTDLWRLAGTARTAPAYAERIQGALGLLAPLDDLPSQESPSHPTPAAEIMIERGNSPPFRLEMGLQPLAGRVPVFLDDPRGPRTVLAEGALAEVFSRRGLSAWEDASLLARSFGEPSRLTLVTPEASITLTRSGPRWGIVDPIVAPAERDACAALLEHLAAVQTAPAPAADFTSPPAFSLTTTTPVARALGAAIDTRPLVREVRLWDDGSQRWTGVSTARWEGDDETLWSSPVSAARDDARAFAAAPGPYLSLRAAALAPADVAALHVEPARGQARLFVRAPDGWTEGDQAAQGTDQERLTDLVRLLCDTPASAATTDTSAAVQPVAGVTLRVGGLDAASLDLGLTTLPLASGPQRVLVLSNGPVRRMYPAAAHQDLLDWLAAPR